MEAKLSALAEHDTHFEVNRPICLAAALPACYHPLAVSRLLLPSSRQCPLAAATAAGFVSRR